MATFYFLTYLVPKYTLADCCTVCFSGKKTLLACVQGGRGWGGKGEGALARRQADCWLYLLVCFFFLVYQPPKSKKITTAPTKKLKSQWNTVTFGGFHHGNCRAEPAVHNTGPTIPNACKWRIYLRDLCQELTCGRLANAKMGYSMDKKEVNSSNFTFKNLYKPLDVCARRYEIVSRLVDHFKNDLGKKKNACALW